MEEFSRGKKWDRLDTICHAGCLLFFSLIYFFSASTAVPRICKCYYQSFEKLITSLYNYLIYIQSGLTGCDVPNCLGIAFLIL